VFGAASQSPWRPPHFAGRTHILIEIAATDDEGSTGSEMSFHAQHGVAPEVVRGGWERMFDGLEEVLANSWLASHGRSLRAGLPPDHVSVHDPTVAFTQFTLGREDVGGDRVQWPGAQFLVRGAEVGAPVDVQVGVVEVGGG
jgi:hypothetical protein